MNNDIRLLGLVLENDWQDKYELATYLWHHGSDEEWVDAQDERDAAQWRLNEWERIFPGVNLCDHGMSAQRCEHPHNHWAVD